jgi:ornithine cyclodeaminase/alanine dehydrogenase-like protein (mu-crystallin family)
MTIIITDEDVKRLLPMRDCIEAMRVAFGDLADGTAVNRPRMRYLAGHPIPNENISPTYTSAPSLPMA